MVQGEGWAEHQEDRKLWLGLAKVNYTCRSIYGNIHLLGQPTTVATLSKAVSTILHPPPINSSSTSCRNFENDSRVPESVSMLLVGIINTLDRSCRGCYHSREGQVARLGCCCLYPLESTVVSPNKWAIPCKTLLPNYCYYLTAAYPAAPRENCIQVRQAEQQERLSMLFLSSTPFEKFLRSSSTLSCLSLHYLPDEHRHEYLEQATREWSGMDMVMNLCSIQTKANNISQKLSFKFLYIMFIKILGP